MSAGKYQADITKGIVLSSGGSIRRNPWPAEVPGLGPSEGAVSFARCEFCPPGIHIAAAGTFVRYGGRAVCETCARLMVEAARGDAWEEPR